MSRSCTAWWISPCVFAERANGSSKRGFPQEILKPDEWIIVKFIDHIHPPQRTLKWTEILELHLRANFTLRLWWIISKISLLFSLCLTWTLQPLGAIWGPFVGHYRTFVRLLQYLRGKSSLRRWIRWACVQVYKQMDSIYRIGVPSSNVCCEVCTVVSRLYVEWDASRGGWESVLCLVNSLFCTG